MRQLKYGVDGKHANLKTFAIDEPSEGGASHEYLITDPTEKTELGHIKFQQGPISANGNGINGVQMEDLLAVCIDRLQGFQSGKFACFENAAALNHLESAMGLLNLRTKERLRRGVEGSHTV